MNRVRYAVIGSGSSANAYIFEYNNYSIIIDNGFSYRQMVIRAKELDFNLENVKYLFLTHTHQDHFKGVEMLSKKLRVPVVVHENLDLKKKLKSHLYKRKNITPGKSYNDGDFYFKAFNTSHDADYSISYHFKLGEKIFTIITDTGMITDEMKEFAFASDVLFIEANYNETMLGKGPYPFLLKQRIMSCFGHLSNKDAISFLNIAESQNNKRLKRAYFCHLSDTNNSIEVLKRDIESSLKWNGSWYICPKGQTVNCE